MPFLSFNNFGRGSSTLTDANDTTFDAATDVDPADENITVTGHAYATGDVVHLDPGGNTIPVGLFPAQLYWVIVVDANTIRLAPGAGLPPANITADGVGTMTLRETAIIDFPRSHKTCAFAVDPTGGKTINIRFTYDRQGPANTLWKPWSVGPAASGSVSNLVFTGPYHSFEVIGSGKFSYAFD
jgi:hypothetical protein